MTWLLVEDDPDIRNVVAVMMQLWGENALALADGNAAWSWLDTVDRGTFKGELPDLALMDIRMPGHTGDQIAARIRQTDKLRTIPIVLMTAFTLTDGEVQSMMARAGIDHLIKKPLPDMDIFKATLYRVRDDRRKANAAPPQPAVLPALEPKPAATPAAAPAAPVLQTPIPAATPTQSVPQPSTKPPATPPAQGVKPADSAEKPASATQVAEPKTGDPASKTSKPSAPGHVPG